MKNKNEDERIVAQFDEDVIMRGGYLYTERPSKSSLTSNNRLTTATLKLLNLKNKKVIDIGCGDGNITDKLYRLGKPKLLVGIDAANKAISKAKKSYQGDKKNLIFKTESCYKISSPDKKFDIAITRGLIHHLQKPQKAIKEILRVADEILIIEPNGYNPILKIIEKVSHYHRTHQERSYFSSTLRGWIESYGGKVDKEDFIGVVPFFCPDWLVNILKKIEPVVEKSFLKKVFCGVLFIKAHGKE